MYETDFFLIGSGRRISTFAALMYGAFALAGLVWAAWVTFEQFSSYLERSSGNNEDFITPVIKGWLVFICGTVFYGAIIF